MLPQEVARLFWDTRPEDLNLQQHRTFILERVLDFGGQASIDWVRSVYSQAEIAEVIRHSRRISRPTANYWAVLLGLDRSEVHCLRERDPFWPH